MHENNIWKHYENATCQRQKRSGVVFWTNIAKTPVRRGNMSAESSDTRRDSREKELKERHAKKRDQLLCSKVPTKTSDEMDRSTPGRMQVDCVEHCGSNASGEYV